MLTDLQEESNGYSVLVERRENEVPDSQMDEGFVHSSDEEEQEGKPNDSEAGEIQASAHDCSGSRPLLLDSEEEADESPHYSTLPSALPSAYPLNMVQNHCQHPFITPSEAYVSTDVFSSAPFQTAQEESGDVFSNAPFLRPSAPAQPQMDVFAQAPFGKRKDSTGAAVSVQPRTQHSAAAAAATEQGVLGHVAQQPFRPQALAKYSRHFDGTVPQTPAQALSGGSAGRQMTVASAHSWTSERSSVDPFVSAPFHLRAPQEKP